MRDDIDCPVYELIRVVGVMFDPFGIVAIVILAARNVDSPAQARLTHVHAELVVVLTVVRLEPFLCELIKLRFVRGLDFNDHPLIGGFR